MRLHEFMKAEKVEMNDGGEDCLPSYQAVVEPSLPRGKIHNPPRGSSSKIPVATTPSPAILTTPSSPPPGIYICLFGSKPIFALPHFFGSEFLSLLCGMAISIRFLCSFFLCVILLSFLLNFQEMIHTKIFRLTIYCYCKNKTNSSRGDQSFPPL